MGYGVNSFIQILLYFSPILSHSHTLTLSHLFSSYLCQFMKTDKTNIRALSRSEIAEYFEDLGEPKFRAGQVYEWIWQKHAFKFEDMTNLSKELRAKLAKDFSF